MCICVSKGGEKSRPELTRIRACQKMCCIKLDLFIKKVSMIYTLDFPKI